MTALPFLFTFVTTHFIFSFNSKHFLNLSYLSLLLIFMLLPISGDIHFNPSPIEPCSVWYRRVIRETDRYNAPTVLSECTALVPIFRSNFFLLFSKYLPIFIFKYPKYSKILIFKTKPQKSLYH